MYSCIFSLIVPGNVEQFLWKPATYIYDLKKLRYSKSLQNDKIHFCKVQQISEKTVQVTISDRFEVILQFVFSQKQTFRKVKFLSKNSILTKPQHFHDFFTQIFFDNFSREIKVVNS